MPYKDKEKDRARRKTGHYRVLRRIYMKKYYFHIDHIIPLSKDGNHTLTNLQITHPLCNLKKGNRCNFATL